MRPVSPPGNPISIVERPTLNYPSADAALDINEDRALGRGPIEGRDTYDFGVVEASNASRYPVPDAGPLSDAFVVTLFRAAQTRRATGRRAMTQTSGPPPWIAR